MTDSDNLFGTTYSTDDTRSVKGLIFDKSNEICVRTTHDGLNLEDKVLLSMAIRLQGEVFITKEIRRIKGDANYWCQSENQFCKLIKEYLTIAQSSPSIRTLEKISITVSSNIHLNAFMYEPILDLTIDHLIDLYKEVRSLNTVPAGVN